MEKSSIVDEYTLGEWLINNSAGFVRRGISGSLILSLSELLSIKPQLFINTALLFLFLVNLSLVALLISFLSLSQTYWLLFSPALFLMIPTDTMARKENLFYFLLLLHTLLIQRKSLWLNGFQKLLLPVLGLLIAFSHEIYVFFIPFHLLLLFLSVAPTPERNRLVLYNLIPFLGFAAATVFPGNYPLRDAMCKTLSQFSIPCKGGIEAIGMSAQVSAAHSLLVLKDVYSVQSYALVYGITNLVTLFLFSSSVSTILDKGLIKTFAIANLTFPLVCFMGWDIGRWISLYSIHNFFVLAAVYHRNKNLSFKSGPEFIRALSFGVVLVLLSLFLNNKYRAQYDRAEYPVTASRIPSFLHSGFNWWVNGPKFNSYTFGRKIKFSISKNETVTSDDPRLYFLGWTEPQNKGRWSTESVPAIVFSLKGDNTDSQGKITLAVSSREGQHLRCYLNGEKVYDDFLRPNQAVIELKFEPQLLGTIVNEHKLEFSFPESTKSRENKSEKESVFVSSILIQ